MRIWLGLAALNCVFVGIAVVNAQAPVITDPGDFRILGVNTVLRPLDPNPGWSEMAPMPTARGGFATAAAGGKIYTIGGAVIHDCATVPTVEAYDPALDLWTTGLAPMPPPLRWRPSGGTLDNLIYVIGGASREHGCPGEALATVQAYDPVTDSWSDKPSLGAGPRAQVGVGIDPVNHLLYAVGGATDGPQYIAIDTVEVFDPSGNGGAGSWTTKQHLNKPRGFPAVAAVNGKIYAIGGQKEHQDVVDTVEEFDPDANGGFGAWTIKPSVMPHPRMQSAAAVLDGKVYVVGGWDGVTRGLLSSVDVYDPSLDTWTIGAPMPTARRVLGAAMVDNAIYAMGGEAQVTRVGEQFIYQITGTNNPAYYDAFPLPDGLQIDKIHGIISGSPTTFDDAFSATFMVTNSSGTDSKDVGFYIAPPAPPGAATIASSTCVTGRAGQPFAFQVLTTDASQGARLVATGLPYEAGVGPQMTIDGGTGLISGMVPPTLDGSAQSFGVELDLTDVTSAQSYLQLTFVSDPLLPVITSSSNATLVLNQFFSYTITADAAVSSYDYLGLDGALGGSLPSGLSFDAATGTISGIYRGDLASKAPAEGAPVKDGARDERLAGGPHAIDTIKKEPPPRIQMFSRQDLAGTGTAPLNFFVGLHDFEVETLRTTTSKGTNCVIYTDDPLASGSGAGMLQSTGSDEYVSYRVPITSPGTYAVKVGVRTGESQGVFQLSIDGADLGSHQDEYSGQSGYEVRNLGPVTFSSPGDKQFQFLVTGRNRESSGHALVLDYLDLVPRFEAETLFVQAHSAPCSTVHASNLSGRAGRLFQASRPGDSLTFTVPVAKAGIYNVRVKTSGNGGGGVFRLLVDGAKQGYPQKENCGSSSGDGTCDLGTVNFRTPGDKAFQFLLAGLGSKTTGADFIVDYIDLVLVTQLEAEKLSAEASAHFYRLNDTDLSRRAGMLLDAKVPGDFVTCKVTVPIAGNYGVKLGVRTGRKSGIVQLAIDGLNQGSAQDGYSAAVGYEVLDLGRVTFTEASEKTFHFLVTGKNSHSSGYQFALDYIDLVR